MVFVCEADLSSTLKNDHHKGTYEWTYRIMRIEKDRQRINQLGKQI